MVGLRISQLRKSHNMTQRDLARALNLSPSAVGMYEQGRRQPSADLIVAICREFSVSTQWLLTGMPYTAHDFRQDLEMLLCTPLPPPGEPMALQEARQLLRRLDDIMGESVIL